MSARAEVPGGRASIEVHHRLEGPPGAPVVALSGSLGTSLEMWDGQVPRLRERYRVLRYDHRGHGRSPVPAGPYAIADLGRDLIALLDRLALERVSLCGLSLGGMVAMWVAVHAPERVDRLALCSTSARLEPPEAWLERAAAVRRGGAGAVSGTVLERWLTPAFRAGHPDAVARVEGMLRATPAEGYASCCEAIAGFDLRGRLAAIGARTLVVAGEDDPATPPEQARLLAAAIPSARLVTLPGAAHLLSVEQPEPLAGALLEHLGEAPEEGG